MNKAKLIMFDVTIINNWLDISFISYLNLLLKLNDWLIYIITGMNFKSEQHYNLQPW